MTQTCIFCRIVAKESPAQIDYEDDEVVAFRDLYPKAPIHLRSCPGATSNRSRASTRRTRR